MREGIAAFALANAHFTIVLFIVIVLLGVVSAFLLPKDLLPSSNTPAVQILSFYPGMPANNVEQELTYPFERYTGQAVGIDFQESRSLPGVSIVRNYFHSNVDLSSAIAQTGSLAMSVLRKLPPGTQPPLVLPFDPMGSTPIALCAVSGEGKSESELQDVGRYWVTNAIQGVPGAMAPTVMGGKLRQATVYLDGKKLAFYNLSPARVNEKLEAMNTFIPAGELSLGDFNYQLHSNGTFSELGEVNDFYLRSRFGTAVKVRDVGSAEDAAAIQTNIVLIDGKPQVYLPIYRQLGANSLRVVDDVKKSLESLESSLHGFKLTIVNDETVFIRKAISSISEEALIGGGLAAFMILLFLGSFRATIAVLLSLPISLIGALAVLKGFGQTLNVMTLGGLALSVGVLVDNAIVVIEVIMRKRAAGANAADAAYEGAHEVAMPVLASTIATLVVFFPVLFLDGVVHTLFSALSLAVIAAMGISYYAAMMMIPLYAAHYMPSATAAAHGILGAFQRWFSRVVEGYGRTLRWTLARSGAVLKWSLILHAAVAIFFLFHIGTELFPRADSGSFRINVRAPTGLRVEKTADLTREIEKKLREIIPAHDLQMIISNSGVYYGYSAAFTSNAGPQDTFINVELTENRLHTSQYYAKLVRKNFPSQFPETEFSVELGGLLTSALNGGLPAPIDIQIEGDNDTQRMQAFATTLLPKLKGIQGAVDVRMQQRFDSPVIDIDLDRRKISDLGLTPDIVLKNVVGAVSHSSSYSPSVWINPKTGIDYPLGVQFPEGVFKKVDQLLDIPITGPEQDRAVRLGEVAGTRYSKGPTELNHKNLKSVIDIYMDSQDRDIGSVAIDAQKILNQTTMPAGYHFEIRGEISTIKNSLSALGWGFLLAAALVYLILVIQFRSFLMPAIIMTNVPKGIVGVIVILALTHTYFSIQAAIGCIFVIGVSVSHSVLLLEFILERVRHAEDRDEAIVSASMARLRPITMTSLASILGLLPMALGMGHGSEANIPLGRAVIGGQLLSTFLNFYLLPCLYRQVAPKAAPAPEVLREAA